MRCSPRTTCRRRKERAGPYQTWERLTLTDYARGYLAVAHEYELQLDQLGDRDPNQAARLAETARDRYRRAFPVKPGLIEANEALKRLAE